MRKIKELMVILLKAIEYEIDNDNGREIGFCHITTVIYRAGIITVDEMVIMDEYICDNMPKRYYGLTEGSKSLSSYGWKPGNLKIRREWLIKQLEN